MFINIEELAKKYTDETTANWYFSNGIYNGSISNCRRYLMDRMRIAEERKDNEFVVLVKKILDGGLVTFTKNNYEINMLTDSTGFINNVKQCKKVVWFTIYNNKTVAYDYPYNVPKYIKEYMDRLAKKL